MFTFILFLLFGIVHFHECYPIFCNCIQILCYFVQHPVAAYYNDHGSLNILYLLCLLIFYSSNFVSCMFRNVIIILVLVSRYHIHIILLELLYPISLTLYCACSEGTHWVLSNFDPDRTWTNKLDCFSFVFVIDWKNCWHNYYCCHVLVFVIKVVILGCSIKKLTQGHLGVYEGNLHMPCQCLNSEKITGLTLISRKEGMNHLALNPVSCQCLDVVSVKINHELTQQWFFYDTSSIKSQVLNHSLNKPGHPMGR